ncbi:MAG: ABC-three component system protein [Bryobacterales bacterium]
MTLQDAYYDERFENTFLRAKGDEFQTFFERLMGLAFKADFMACRPWGREGDRKNDGFLRSERRLFQVYGPNEIVAAKTIAKITEDFEGAKVYWATHFSKWSFVHNAEDGLPPHVQRCLLDFMQGNPGIEIQSWGLEELRLIFRKLTTDDKASWFGPAPTDATTLDFNELQIVLERIAALPSPMRVEVQDIPMGKIEANALNDSVAQLLKAGMAKSPLVEEFFSQWHDETLGERLAEAFKAEYQRLHLLHSPNRVFSAIQSWAGGTDRGTPEHQVAVLAVIAYYFERCDIFEEPRRETE